MFLTLIAGLISLLLTALIMPHFIKFYQMKKIGGQQMHEDVKQHLAKAGTPTMGGDSLSPCGKFCLFSICHSIF